MEDGGVLLGLSSAHRGEYLLDAEHVDVTARALGVALDVGHEFVGSPYAFCARRMSPWSWIRSLFFVRGDSADGSPARHCSMVDVSMSSTRIDPKAGSRCAAIVER
jgi:hypothetical protein